ncbi:hypothetical protein [Roseomonas fluvialis]|uniref:Sel1 repeat family protein n=1 Tax=Roseomonas fluvialis TaxID=1750527 RepID=A0ABN6P163_9PROT|nr:hypothetical protein [Roseomonas fluvialis]BDG72206.1 hypothetical protein Rmf_21350 [Roseomonas fluvialis]
MPDRVAAFRRGARAGSAPPPHLAGPLLALWWDARGDWTRAHEAAQAGEDAASAWVHAYLHRKEGDLANAGYWYRRAGRPVATGPLDQEWASIAGALLP